MAVFGTDPNTGFTMDPSFYGGDTSTPSAPAAAPSGFTMDPSFYGGDDTSSGAMPGTGASPSGGGLGSVIGSDITSLFTGGVTPYAPAAGAGGPGTSLALFGHPRGTHLNKSAYYRKVMGVPVRVPKGTVNVTNRRRNAGNAKAVKRALTRIAMFDNLARRVESEMSRVARRHHRPARAACAPSPRRGHRPGCRCFACRR